MHYRSIFNVNTALQTPANITQVSLNLLEVFDETAGSQFWKTAGGARDPGFGNRPTWMNAPGIGVPEPSTIVVRGGRVFINIANPGTVDTITARIQMAFVKSQTRNRDDNNFSNTLGDYITAIVSGSKPFTYDITSEPDYSEYFYKPVVDKSFELKALDSFMITFKLKTMKIDADVFNRGSGWFPYWIITLGQRVDITAGAATLNVVNGHNLSFAMMDTLDT